MTAIQKLISGLCMTGLAVTVALAARPMPGKVSTAADEPGAVTRAAGVGLNYLTGFEASEGFVLGHIGNGTQPLGCGGVVNPCWGKTSAADASVIEGHIDSVNPFAGAQHLRISHDPTTRTNQPNFGLGVDARFPRTADLTVRPAAANTVSVEMAISALGGMNYRIQPQGNSQSCIESSTLFSYTGGIYVLDDVCGSTEPSFQPTGFDWDASGNYQTFVVGANPCTDSMSYFYGGQQIYYSCLPFAIILEQFLVFGDNFPGSTIDVDNVALWSQDECGSVCGNGILEPPSEECDWFTDSNCPGRCLQDCTCAPLCTQANPCPVANGPNGPYITSDGYYLYSGASPSISIDTCGSSFDSVLAVATAAAPGSPLASNDNCNAGQFGAGADESASCYDGIPPFNDSDPSCTCIPNPGQPILIQVQMISSSCRPVLGYSTIINVRKKSVCEGESVGACCDTNGADTSCTDNALAADCVGADKVFTDQGKCNEIQCACVPLCSPGLRPCGDDGCGGSCGSCGDNNTCNGVETCGPNGQCVDGTPLVCNDGNACNGIENCIPSLGCFPATPLVCSDGVACNGQETCNPASGCVPGTPVNCEDGVECTVDSCNEPDGSCTNDDADCSIPTVSEWGLVVLTLMLLIGAKTRFARHPSF